MFSQKHLMMLDILEKMSYGHYMDYQLNFDEYVS